MNILCTGNRNKEQFYELFNLIFEKYNNKFNSIYIDSFTAHHTHSNKIIDDIYKPANKIDFVISLGGDGSILSAVSRMNNCQIPILGIHIGELGFLNQANLNDYNHIIDDILSRDSINYSTHSLLTASICNTDKTLELLYSLNDFAINQKTY